MYERQTILSALTLAAVLAMSVAGPAGADTDPNDPATNLLVERTAAGAFNADGLCAAPCSDYPDDADDFIEVNNGPQSDCMEARVFLARTRDAGGNESLRIYFSVHDVDLNAQDAIEFYFDRLHNHGTSPDSELEEDVLLRIPRDDCVDGACSFEVIRRDGTGNFNAGTPLAVPAFEAQIRENNPGEYANGWTGELELTPEHLGWGYFAPAPGLMVVATSGNSNLLGPAACNVLPTPQAFYPAGGGFETDPADWANLKLRYPIDYALVLDFSGSMLALDGLADNRWARAKRAADLFVAGLGLFLDDSCGGSSCLDDRIFASQYNWACGDDTASGDGTGAITGVPLGPTAVPPPPTGSGSSFMAGNASDPPGNNCTPIRRGLDFAINDSTQLDYPSSSTTDKRDRIVVLLSDGFHNKPSTQPFTPFAPDNPATVFAAPIGDDFTRVRTVALGPDGTSGTDLLSAIAVDFGGAAAVPGYNMTQSFSELLAAYLDTLQEPLTVNQVGDDDLAACGSPDLCGSFQPGEPDKLVFIAVWDDPSQADALSVTDGTDTCPATFVDDEVGYAAVVVDNADSADPCHPTPGATWQFDIPGTTAAPDQRYALADLRILSRFLVEQKRYAAGDPIVLGAKLLDTNQPILGADVTVEIAGPGEGLGNFLATTLKNCSKTTPRLPQPGDVDIDINSGPPSTSAAVAASGDPIPGRHGQAASLFDACGLTGLDRDNLPGEPLRDDGSGPDAVAGDGIYSLRFTDTGTEGTYTFRFHVRGTTDDGIDFARTRTVSVYVGVEPDADATEISFIPGGIAGGFQTASLYILPQDRIPNYLGPGFASSIRVTLDGGDPVGDLVDLGNGIYLQQLQYPEGEPRPDITIGLPGGSVKTVGSHRFELVAPLIGYTGLDSGLFLDDGFVLGARVAWRVRPQLFFGLEAANTFTESPFGDSGNLLQLLLNLRYDFGEQEVGAWTPFVTGGVGVALLRGVGADDDALLVQAGAGATYRWSDGLGLRLDARALTIDDLLGTGTTANWQTTAGLVFYFD